MLKNYIDGLKDKNVAVIGAGVSNTPLIRLLCDAGVSLTVYDKKPLSEFSPSLSAYLSKHGVKLVCGSDYLKDVKGDVIFRSPGVRPDAPSLLKAKENGACVTSEMELFFKLCPCPVTAVTGSDGKTTTSTLISELLKAQGYNVFLGGNIGTPLLDKVPEISPDDRVVLELSSFQLFDMTRSPHTAVVTNVTPNHLDWHKDMAEYASSKFNILKYQTENDTAVLNSDDETTRSFAEKACGCVRFFSMSNPSSFAYYDGEFIFLNGEKLLSGRELIIPGRHNIANFMTACCAVYDDVSRDNMIKVARAFTGVEHRIEFVREISGARYYNDSIGSSPTRTIAGLSCFNGGIILIAGGYDKHIPFDRLGDEICKKVSLLLLCGATSEKIKNAVLSSSVPQKPRILVFDNLSDTVNAAFENARQGDTVLFSPACASFDMFPNFMERGKAFKSLVNNLSK